MSNPEEFQPILEKMRRNWDERATQNAAYYIYTGVRDSQDFNASGRVNYEQILRPSLPVLLRGRSPKHCRVLEIGCGMGRITAALASQFKEVHAVDVSAEMVAKARENLAADNNVTVHLGSGMDLLFLPDEYFDLVFSYIVFQHIPSRTVIENYLRESARVLKIGGAIHFQLNGYTAPDYAQSEKDTWQGEAFSFPEAVQMLEKAGFSPFNAIGAGTQYFFLSARRPNPASSPLSPFILPGRAWLPAQLIDGWQSATAADCRPIEMTTRLLLGVPPGKSLRLFVALDCGPAKDFPKLIITLEQTVLRELEIGGPGDHYWEFVVPPELCNQSRLQITLQFEVRSAEFPVSIRSLGIYAPVEEQQREQPLDAATRAANIAADVAERLFWIANLEQECGRLASAVSPLEAEIKNRIAWAQSLERDVAKARAELAKLQGEFADRSAWALSLDAELQTARAALAELQSQGAGVSLRRVLRKLRSVLKSRQA